MPPKNKPLTIYLDDTAVTQLEDLRTYFSERQGGIQISDSYIGRALIAEKHIELVDRQNNRARLTTVVEEIAELKKEVARLAKLIEEGREEHAPV